MTLDWTRWESERQRERELHVLRLWCRRLEDALGRIAKEGDPVSAAVASRAIADRWRQDPEGDAPALIGEGVKRYTRDLDDRMRARMAACREQKHGAARLVFVIIAGGSHQLQWYCDTCGNVTRDKYDPRYTCLPFSFLDEHGIDRDSVPVIKDASRIQVCARCAGVTSCEQHHIWPREIYGDIANDFALAPLCRPCHVFITTIHRKRLQQIREEAIAEYRKHCGCFCGVDRGVA